MEVSRLTFTKETKEKMEKPIDHFKKGQLRWKKLHELENSGKLCIARNRQDILQMMGLSLGYGAPYSWLSNMIVRGHLKETLTGFDKSQKPEYEYHIVGQPDYDFRARKNTKKATAKKDTDNTTTAVVVTSPVSETKMVIKYKDLAIELYNIDASIVKGIIETLADI